MITTTRPLLHRHHHPTVTTSTKKELQLKLYTYNNKILIMEDIQNIQTEESTTTTCNNSSKSTTDEYYHHDHQVINEVDEEEQNEQNDVDQHSLQSSNNNNNNINNSLDSSPSTTSSSTDDNNNDNVAKPRSPIRNILKRKLRGKQYSKDDYTSNDINDGRKNNEKDDRNEIIPSNLPTNLQYGQQQTDNKTTNNNDNKTQEVLLPMATATLSSSGSSDDVDESLANINNQGSGHTQKQDYDNNLFSLSQEEKKDDIGIIYDNHNNNSNNNNNSSMENNKDQKIVTQELEKGKKDDKQEPFILPVISTNNNNVTKMPVRSILRVRKPKNNDDNGTKRVVSFSDENGGKLSSHVEIEVSPGKLTRRVRRPNMGGTHNNNSSHKNDYIYNCYNGNNDNNSTDDMVETKPTSILPWPFSSIFSRKPFSQNNRNVHEKQHQQEDDYRVLILLMDPPNKQYELTSITFPYYSKLPGFEHEPVRLRELIPLISTAATHEPFKVQTYIGFTRPTTGIEMLNTLTVADYSIKKDEVLAAIPEGYLAQECSRFAKPVLETPRLVRLLKKLKRAERKQDKLKSRGEDIFKAKEIRKIDERKVGGGFFSGCLTGGIMIALFVILIKTHKQWIENEEIRNQQQILEAQPCFGNILCRMKKFEQKKIQKAKEEGNRGKQMVLARMFDEYQFPDFQF